MAYSSIQKVVALAGPARAAASARPASPEVRGILLLLTSTLFFSVTDAITKHLTASLPAGEIAWMRYVTFALLVFPMVFLSGGASLLRSQKPLLQILRGLGVVGSTLLFIHGLRYLPVADSTAIYFVSPILIMALSIVFLGETVGWRRWSAAAVGLIGVLIVIRPGTSAFQSAALLPLLGATSWAIGAIVTRKINGDHALTTMAYSSLMGTVILGAALPLNWVTPDWSEIGLGLVAGVLFSIGQWLVILAYRCGNASTIAPFSYIQILWAGGLGYLMFGRLPDQWTILGAGIIAASGIYTAYRERIRAREVRTSA